MANIGTGTAQSSGLSIAGITGVSDNDVLIDFSSMEQYDEYTLSSLLGVMEVDVSVDGTNFNSIIALTDEESTTPATRVLITVAAQPYSFKGNYKRVRVRQASATAVTVPVLNCRRAPR